MTLLNFPFPSESCIEGVTFGQVLSLHYYWSLIFYFLWRLWKNSKTMLQFLISTKWLARSISTLQTKQNQTKGLRSHAGFDYYFCSFFAANCIAGYEAWVWLSVCDRIEMMKLIRVWRWQFSKEKESMMKKLGGLRLLQLLSIEIWKKNEEWV